MTCPLLVHPHAADAQGRVLQVTPQSAGWRHVGFEVRRLQAEQSFEGGADDRETCVVLVTGAAEVSVDGRAFGVVGGRTSVFHDTAPGVVYAPARARFVVTAAAGGAEVALCSAPAQRGARAPISARSIESEHMPREVRGRDTNTRYVRNILPESEPAESLLVVEVVTPGGHWSSYPPHKHDTAAEGEETELEETYYHRFSSAQGFAFQRVYTDDRSLDETMCIGDGDVVMVPRGYHPVAASHGYDLYYLNVMAGPERKWIFRNDPAHDWISKLR